MQKTNILGIDILVPKEQEQLLTKVLCELSNAEELPDMIETDENGLISHFSPNTGMTWDAIFFFQNLMISQRLQLLDNFLKEKGVIK